MNTTATPDKPPASPRPVLGPYHQTMWDSVRERRFSIQRCTACGHHWYPPGPACPRCLSSDFAWVPVQGGATILSWVVFHRGYLPAYPPPYNVITVRLDEGPIMVSNLQGIEPSGSWIGQRVRLTYGTLPDGMVLPRFELAT